MSTYYDILQVSRDATADEIKEAYRALAWQSQSDGGQERLKAVNEAYAVLSSPQRRSEYDRMLDAGDAGNAGAAGDAGGANGLRPAVGMQPANLDRQGTAAASAEFAQPAFTEPAEGPGVHPFLRLFGFSFSISHWFSRMRYYYIPFNLVLGVAAAYILIANVGNYVEAPSIQTPHPSSVEKVVKGQDKGYISVAGRRNKEAQYETKKNGSVTGRYYPLFMGSYVVLVKGDNLPIAGTFTGMLRAPSAKLIDLIEADAKDPANKNLHIATNLYLDTSYTPTKPVFYLWLIIALALAVPVLLIPPLFGYTLFRRGTARDAAPAGGPAWPVPVLASGRFTVRESGQKGNETFVPASLVRTGQPDRPLEVWFDRAGRRGGLLTYVLSIPADSTVEWGYAYGNGKPMPAVVFRSGGRRSLLTVPTEQDARQIAALFASGSLNV